MYTKRKIVFAVVMSLLMMLGLAAPASFACDRPVTPVTGYDKYTVNYLEKGTGKVLAEQKVVTNQPIGSTVTEKAIDIEGYNLVDEAVKSITIKATQCVAMTTTWSRITPCSRLSYTNTSTEKSVIVVKKGYRYIVWTPNALTEAGKKAIYESVSTDVNGMFGAKYEEFTFFSGTDKRYEGIRVSCGRLEFDCHCTWSMFCVGKYRTYTNCCGKNEINFYYEAVPKESYKVNYLEQGTDRVLAPQKVVTDQTVGTTVTEQAIDIDGYTVVGADTQDLTIKQSKIVKKTDFATPTDNNGGWKRITPCNKLTWVNEGTQRSVVVAKKGHDYIVWTLDALTATEKEAIYKSFKANVKGMNGAYFCNVKFISGNGASYGGVTVCQDMIKFDYHCTWSLYAMGLYTKASEEIIEIANNELTFYYEKIPAPQEVTYTVRYIDMITNNSITSDKVVDTAMPGELVTEYPASVPGYTPLQDKIEWTVQDGDVQIFIYYYSGQQEDQGYNN